MSLGSMAIPANMPSTASLLSMYTTFTTAVMLVRTASNEVQSLANQLIPERLRDVSVYWIEHLFGNFTSQMTVIIDEYRGMSRNEIYSASEAYLSTKISPSIRAVEVSRVLQEKDVKVSAAKGERIVDLYEGITITWEFVSKNIGNQSKKNDSSEKRSLYLSFHKKHKDVVLGAYLQHVMEMEKLMQEERKVVRLYAYGFQKYNYGKAHQWGSVDLNHPSTFDTLAMDPELKEELINDLDRFLMRRDYYKRVGKAWKRGYLLYGPPGTGKLSLIAAMANYLNFDIYDLELKNVSRNSDLKGILTGTSNRSILVIEDIDCSVELQDREHRDDFDFKGRYGDSDKKKGKGLTLSGLLNFIDGLWSSCGDARIIVFTTNYKDKIDPALLRPGRMDMHIHMSYCTPNGFRILASNYLSVKSHRLFPEIEEMMTEVQVTPAEVAEELMKGEDTDIALSKVLGFLQQRKRKRQEEELEIEKQKEVDTEVTEKSQQNKLKKSKNNMRKRPMLVVKRGAK